MALTIDVIYDGKVLKPQTPLDLKPNEHYLVTIEQERPASAPPSLAGEDEALAWRIYDSQLKELLEPAHNGEVVAVHLASRDYEVSPRSVDAWNALKVRHPEGPIVLIDIGPAGEHDSIELRQSSLLPSKRKAS